MLPQPTRLEMLGFNMPRNHKLYWIFNEMIQQLVEKGIVQYHTEDHYGRMKLSRFFREEDLGPQVLTLEDLEASFVLWFATVPFAVAAFLFELMIALKDLVVISAVFKSYFQCKISEHVQRFLEAEGKEDDTTHEDIEKDSTSSEIKNSALLSTIGLQSILDELEELE